jgi:hypothetical protein
MAADVIAADGKAIFEQSRAEQQQLSLVDPLTAEELFEAKERLGPNAGMVALMRDARSHSRGRKKGSRNRRTDDFKRYIGQFGPPAAVTLKKIASTSPDELVARSQMIDPEKRRLSYGDAISIIARCAEATLPYEESKLPVAVELSAKGDFNLIIPGVNVPLADAEAAAAGSFVLEAEYLEVDEAEDGK